MTRWTRDDTLRRLRVRESVLLEVWPDAHGVWRWRVLWLRIPVGVMYRGRETTERKAMRAARRAAG